MADICACGRTDIHRRTDACPPLATVSPGDWVMTVDEALAWAGSGNLNAGPRTTKAITVLAGEVTRLRAALSEKGGGP